MLKQLILGIAIVLTTLQSQAQEKKTWSLSDCIEHALENNISIKQQDINLKTIELDVKQSKMDMLPTLNSYVTHYYSWGRYVDPFTNEFSTERIMGDQFGLSSSVSVYEGLQKQNTLKRNKLELDAQKHDTQKLLDDISLNIANQYVSVLYAMENLDIAANQYAITQQQVSRTQKLVDAGTLAKGDLLNIQSQAAAEQYSMIQARNDLDIAYLNLAQMLDLENVEGFKIEKPDLALGKNPSAIEQVNAIYNYAVENQPEIKSSELGVEVAIKDYEIAKGMQHPTLTVTGSLSTGYSEATLEATGYSQEDYAFGTTESGELVYTSQSYPTGYDISPFSDQISDNLSESVNIQLSIPIFNNWSVKSYISKTALYHENSKYELELKKQNLRKNIQSAHADARASQNQYKSAEAKLSATQEAFKYAEKKFNVGLINSVEYNDAKKELTNARSQLLNAKYRLVFTRTVLNYYLGKPITIAN